MENSWVDFLRNIGLKPSKEKLFMVFMVTVEQPPSSALCFIILHSYRDYFMMKPDIPRPNVSSS